ncbi:MAG: hypothetical protein H0V47_05225 [Chloroflexia bacterium]|nr:hypothetical protein [Chloroflexia bacterium]
MQIRSVNMALRSGALVLSLVVLTACGGGGDSESVDPTVTVAPAGPTSTLAATAEVEAEDEPTSTATAEMTSTPEATATITPSPTLEPPTPTPTNTPTPTATPLPTVQTPFDTTRPVGEALTNFTLDYSARFDGAEGEDGAVDLRIAQASPDSYHLQVATLGQQTEAWRVNEIIYVLGPGGAVVELPGVVDQNLYAPASFLALAPDPAMIELATVLGENVDVAGRSTTHYEIDPAAASAYRPSQSEVGDDVEGTFEVWVDNELDIVIQLNVDVNWTGGVGETQAIGIDYLVTGIDSTPEAQPPV